MVDPDVLDRQMGRGAGGNKEKPKRDDVIFRRITQFSTGELGGTEVNSVTSQREASGLEPGGRLVCSCMEVKRSSCV